MSRALFLLLYPFSVSACLSAVPMIAPGARLVPVRIESATSEPIRVVVQPATGQVDPCEFVPCNRCIASGTALFYVEMGEHRYERQIVIKDEPSRLIVRRNLPPLFWAGLSLSLGSLPILASSWALSDEITKTAQSYFLDPHWEEQVARLQAIQIGLASAGLAMAVAGFSLTFRNMKRDRIETKPWPKRETEDAAQCQTQEHADSTAAPELPRPVPAAKPQMLSIPRPAPHATFLFDIAPVTVKEYEKCVRSRGCTAPEQGEFCNFGRIFKGSHPVNCVSQEQAAFYCSVQGKRLPSDDEWEYVLAHLAAPQGASGAANVSREDRQGPPPVGSLRHASGLSDLTGSLWQWSANPAGRSWGGSWDSVARPIDGVVSQKNTISPSAKLPTVGFRCAAEP